MSFALAGEEGPRSAQATTRQGARGCAQPRQRDCTARLLNGERAGITPGATERVVVTGGAGQLPGLSAFVAEFFGKPVRGGHPQAVYGWPAGATSPAYSTVLGLAQSGVRSCRRRAPQRAAFPRRRVPQERWALAAGEAFRGAGHARKEGLERGSKPEARAGSGLSSRTRATDMKPRIAVIGVGGAGGNAINNMIAAGLSGVDFIVANTDAQALEATTAATRVQLGVSLTEGLGAGSKPEIGEAAAEEALEEIRAGWCRLPHGVHRRGHGRRHRHGCRLGDRPHRQGIRTSSPLPW